MTISKRSLIVIVLLGIFFTIFASGNGAIAQDRGGRHQGPPPEAYTACEGKSAGDKAEFESPRGDTVTGTCEQQGDRLVLRPDNPPKRRGRNTFDVDGAFAQDRGGRRPGPPPEAYTACEGKSPGDKAEFESPRGDTVTGTCVQQGDRLFLRPDNPPKRRGRKSSTS